MADLKSIVRWLGVVVSIISVIIAILTYHGIWNEWRGDDLAEAVADRFDKSYAEGASQPVRDGDKEWSPVLRLITKYSHANLAKDKKPLVLARAAAIASAKDASGAEWTAPTTPIAVFYKDWPTPEISPGDWTVVGTIEDLHNWIRRDEADFDFLLRTIILGVLSCCVGVFLALPDRSKPLPATVESAPGLDDLLLGPPPAAKGGLAVSTTSQASPASWPDASGS